jgi:hypothetical protein
MFLHQSAYLDQNLYLGVYLGHRNQQLELSTGKKRMWIHISGWQIDDFGTLSSRIVAGSHGSCSVQRWRRFWCRLSVSAGWRYTSAFAPPVCLQNLLRNRMAIDSSLRVVLTKHCHMSFYPTLQIVTPRKRTSLLVHFSDLSGSLLDQILHVLLQGLW